MFAFQFTLPEKTSKRPSFVALFFHLLGKVNIGFYNTFKFTKLYIFFLLERVE